MCLTPAEHLTGRRRRGHQGEAREEVRPLDERELGDEAREAVAEDVRGGPPVLEDRDEVVDEQPVVVLLARRVEVLRAGVDRPVVPGDVVRLDAIARGGEQREEQDEVLLRPRDARDQHDARRVGVAEPHAGEAAARRREDVVHGAGGEHVPVDVGNRPVELEGVVDRSHGVGRHYRSGSPASSSAAARSRCGRRRRRTPAPGVAPTTPPSRGRRRRRTRPRRGAWRRRAPADRPGRPGRRHPACPSRSKTKPSSIACAAPRPVDGAAPAELVHVGRRRGLRRDCRRTA